MRSLVISIFLYACESWTLTAELEKGTQAFEMRCYRRLLNISYKDHVTNEEVRRKIQAAIGEYDELLTLVKKRKLRRLGHVSRSSGLAKTILQGTVKGKRKRGRQKKRWEDNIKEWTGMDFASSTRAAENRSRWKVVVANSFVVPDDLPRLWDRIEIEQLKNRHVQFNDSIKGMFHSVPTMEATDSVYNTIGYCLCIHTDTESFVHVP